MKSNKKYGKKYQYGGNPNDSLKKAFNPSLANDPKFQTWYSFNTIEGKNNIPYSDKLDYDYLSYYMNGDYKNYKGGHFPDTYKRPNHPTFSNESIYSTPENPGGTWKGDKYIPHKSDGGKIGSEIGSGVGMALNLIPGVGTIASAVATPLLGALGNFIGNKLDKKDNNPIQTNHFSEYINPTPYGTMKSGGWIQKAINPAHKGYCTPLSKSTCTGHRRALALMFKKNHGFHKKEDGGMNNTEALSNDDLIKYQGASHEEGGININQNGIPSNNGSSAEVEGGESNWRNYIFSDTIGINKKKEIELSQNKVHKTFSDLAKKVDKKLGGRENDEYSNKSKEIMYNNIIQKNEQALEMKYGNKFKKKYGGLNKYGLGGYDPLMNIGTGLDYLGNDNSTSDPNSADNLFNQNPNGFLPNSNYSVPGSSELSPIGGNSNSFGNNWTQYLSPAFNIAAAGISALNKNKNYLQKADYSGLRSLEAIPTEPSYQESLNVNTRANESSNYNAKINSPSISNSLGANNLGIKLNADNQVMQNANNERLNRITQKLGLIAQEKDRLSELTQGYKHQFNIENTQDKAIREQSTLGYLSQAANDIQNIGIDKTLEGIIPNAWKYYTYDPSTKSYKLKNDEYATMFNIPMNVPTSKDDKKSN